MERCHEKYGSAIFINPDLKVFSTAITDINDIEILTVELEACTVTSVYKPPNIDFQFNEPVNFRNKKHQIVMGDFNSRSVTWGYSNTDKNGEALEDWAELNGLKIIHDSKLPCSFQSGRWRRGTNPDNIFVSNSLASQSVKLVEDPIPRTQHRAITCQITTIIKVESQPFSRKFNFKKARWTEFSEELDTKIIDLPPTVESYEAFKDLVQKISRKHIPRGCRTKYITGLDEHSKLSLEKYQELYENDPFSDETILAGEELVQSLSDSRSKKWCNLLESLDMKHNSRRAWKLVKNLSNDPSKPTSIQCNVTANQIAHQLLLNGKTTTKKKRMKITRNIATETSLMSNPFDLSELNLAIKEMKTNKAPGIDNIRTEQIKQFGALTLQWILDMMNNCISEMTIPKMWRKAHVVALLKPGKDPNDVKNFRPVSLLCHLFKVL